MPTIDCALQPGADETNKKEAVVVFGAFILSFLLYFIKNKLGFFKKRRSRSAKN